jgi:mRNA interferase MazF
VVTTDTLNRMRRTIVVVPLSTSPQAAPPVLVRVTCSGRPAVAVTDQIRAVSRKRLLERLDTLSAAELLEVEDGLREVFEL